MTKRLKRETAKLKKSWMQYDEAMLRNYLVEQMEDPRINLQSILTRHFLIESLFGKQFAAFEEEELRFATGMNWLFKLLEKELCPEGAREILDALGKGADNAGGVEIPHFISRIFTHLPVVADGMAISNYMREALQEAPLQTHRLAIMERHKAKFQSLWRQLLARRRPHRVSALEPACGSANDYRFLKTFGLARFLDYAGFDLCEKNIRNAKRLFPNSRFKVGNAFEIESCDKAFDFCFVHDLFEHLSIKGMELAIREICRVTRKEICAGFFNMAEVKDHVVRRVDDYHWNTLSMARTREVFGRYSSAVQVTHIGTLQRWCFHCPETYNEGAYTFVVRL